MLRARTLVALAIVIAPGCRGEIQLGDPRANAASVDATVATPASARCLGVPSRSVVADLQGLPGELRAIAVGAGTLHALLAVDGSDEGLLARVPTTGGALTTVATVGHDPSALALAPDGSFAFVAARASAQVFRVDRGGALLAADARGAPAAIVSDSRGGAFWTLPASDGVVGWDFARGAPAAVAASSAPSALVRAEDALLITSSGSLSVFVPGVDLAPRKIADRCDARAPVSVGAQIYCLDGDALLRIDRADGATSVVATGQLDAGALVVGAGRLFWRATPSADRTLVMALPLDGTGGPTVVESSDAGPVLLAVDGCDLYFTAGSSIVRRGL